MRTTPTAVLEVILNLPPLHIHIQGNGRNVQTYAEGNSTKSNSRDGVSKLAKELKADPIIGMPSDTMIPRYTLRKKYT